MFHSLPHKYSNQWISLEEEGGGRLTTNYQRICEAKVPWKTHLSYQMTLIARIAGYAIDGTHVTIAIRDETQDNLFLPCVISESSTR